MLIHFIGARTRAFTIDSPTGIQVGNPPELKRYYVEPGKPVNVDSADSKALIERDPHLWALEPKGVEVAPVVVQADDSADDKPGKKR